jgi:hypothetical protein
MIVSGEVRRTTVAGPVNRRDAVADLKHVKEALRNDAVGLFRRAAMRPVTGRTVTGLVRRNRIDRRLESGIHGSLQNLPAAKVSGREGEVTVPRTRMRCIQLGICGG